jgi:ribosomal subunit interface protein
MQVPLQITFRAVPPSPVVRERVEHHVAKLETFFDRITSCHVTLDAPHRHRSQGNHFSVRIDINVPGREVVVTRDPAERSVREDLFGAIDEAFADASRLIEEHARRARAFEPSRAAP